MTQDNFWVSDLTDSFNFVKHNETDHQGFKDYEKTVNERFEKLELKRARAERIASLEKWDKALPQRWAEAKLNLIAKPVIAKIIASLKAHPNGSFFLMGESGAGKTFVAYAIARRMIGAGVATPSQVKVISESMIYSWSSRGFQGQDQLDKLLDPIYKLYIFDGIGTLDQREADKVASFWEQILDHVYSNDLTAVFTSADELSRFAETLSPSGEAKLRTLVDTRTFSVESIGSVSAKNK